MFVDVILPLPLSGSFTYSVPTEIKDTIKRGARVIVPFGMKKYYTAIVVKIDSQVQGDFIIKEIHSLKDLSPVVTEQQLTLWEWISYYYLCAQGDVFKAALPPSMVPSDLSTGYTPKNEIHFKLNPTFDNEKNITPIGKTKKQQALLDEIELFLVENKRETINRAEVKILHGYSDGIFAALKKKELILETTLAKSRLFTNTVDPATPSPLSDIQQSCLQSIQQLFSEKQAVLLHGITSSGKTEIYIHLIEQILSKGMQTLYLLPEIALTTQLAHRLQAVFGDKIRIYHSAIDDQERTEIWQKMLSDNPYEIILGVRSSLFLPFQRLGLVIVDEEHDTSYKQQDPSPRYHARDTAIMLAYNAGANVLLGSATPSIESYHNAQTGKYGLVTLNKRHGDIELPKIILANTKDLRRRKKMKTVLAPALIEEINNALENGEQAIIFRNRRGFTPMVECEVCGWTPKCLHCDVSLTYYKREEKLQCHYCNSTYAFPSDCPSCHHKEMKYCGNGTERLEEEVSEIFPHAIVGRMDSDTTTGKNAFEKIITDFQENKIQILIGTQMISKGLDFGNVRVVGIIAADALLNYPDFHSHERGFQLMVQTAGRSGRRDKQGAVIIQTNNPEYPIYRHIVRNNYEGFFQSQITERKLFHYPPFTRLISVILKDKNEQKVEMGATNFAQLLKQSFGNRVLGPNKPVVSRIQQLHIREILLKIDNQYTTARTRELINEAEATFRTNEKYKYIVLHYNVDSV